MAQFGKALGIILRAHVNEEIMHMDVNAFYAPSECHDLVRRGEFKRLREARRHGKSVSGMSRRQFNIALKRVSGRVRYQAMDRLMVKYCPFGGDY